MTIVVPLQPPSANHYKKFRVVGRTAMFFHTDTAKAWWEAVAACIGGRTIEGKRFKLSYTVYQGAGNRGDVDNYAKCICDALVRAKLLPTDDRIVEMHAYKFRDRENPRTVIDLEPLDASAGVRVACEEG